MLDYLFTATFTDDTSIQQTPEDVSVVEPTKSAFYDVLHAIESGKQLATFTLTGHGHTYSVNLLDGHFEMNSAPVWLIPEGLGEDPEEFRIIYYRQHTHHFVAGSLEETGHLIRYVLGWQVTVDRKNYQQTITLD